MAQRFSEIADEINIAASKYTVDLARSLDLLNSNLVWTDLGHLLNIVACDSIPGRRWKLSTPEKILFFRLFLEFDGAALIFLSRKLEAQEQLPDSDETWSDVAQQLFLDTYEQYLKFVTDTQLRTQIRQLAEKRRNSPFRGHSGRHQSLIHINTLFRLGLVDISSSSQGRTYLVKKLSEQSRSPTSKLLSYIPDVKALEEIVEARSLYHVVGRVLGIDCENGDISDAEFMSRVTSVYEKVLETGVSLCSLQTVSEALQIQSLANDMCLESYATILSRLRDLQNKMPSQIRFHVDRYGRPAYLKIG